MIVRRIALIAVSLAAVGAAARPAPAAYVTGCCACLPNEKVATTAGPPVQMNIPALFCGQVAGMAGPAFAERCNEAGGGGVVCQDPDPGETCGEALAGAGIDCPARPGAPVAGAWGVTGLIAALGALGADVLRRRAR